MSDKIQIAGSYTGTLQQFEHRCNLVLAEEQEKIAPDNVLIALLCDAVRINRELGTRAKPKVNEEWPPCHYLSNMGQLHPAAKSPCNGLSCVNCRKISSCNLHDDCMVAQKLAGRFIDHCHDEGCEDCFGN